MERRVRTADQLRRTDAAAALQGGIWETEDSQNTFTDGQGNKYWLIDTTAGNVSVALPAAADVSPDTIFNVKRTTGGANTLTVTPDSGNIDGSAAHSIATQYAAFGYASDGSNYHIVRQYSPGEFITSASLASTLASYVTSNSLSAAVATDALTVRGSGAISATASVGFVNLTGGHIKFPASQNASTNANTLDDYEEGTFTPAIAFGGSSSGVTYSFQVGNYVKIGRLVWVLISIGLTNNGTGTGIATITGLPFTCGVDSGLSSFYWTGGSGVVGNPTLYISGGGTSGTIYMSGATAVVTMTHTNITDTGVILFSGVYYANG